MSHPTHPHDDQLRASAGRFLEAERLDDAASSDRALGVLLRALPDPVPGADFVSGVLARAGLVRAASKQRFRRLDRRLRWPVAAAVVSGGFAVAYLLPAVVVLVGRIDWLGAIGRGVQWIGGLLAGADDVLIVGRVLSALFEAVWLLLTSPQVLLPLVALAALTAFLGRLMAELVHSPRNRAHV